MDWYEAALFLPVEGWSQTITNGEDGLHRHLRITTRTGKHEELVFGAEGLQRLCNILVSLSVIRGKPEKVPDRGIGILAYYPQRVARDGTDEMEQFVGGWFWLPEALYDEVWIQAREHQYDYCVVEVRFGAVELAGGAFRWNTDKNRIASITNVDVRFERKLKLEPEPEPEPPASVDEPLEPLKKRGFFSSGRLLLKTKIDAWSKKVSDKLANRSVFTKRRESCRTYPFMGCVIRTSAP